MTVILKLEVTEPLQHPKANAVNSRAGNFD